MQCKHCGRDVEQGLAFCPFCGKKMENEANENELKSKLKKIRIAEKLVSVLIFIFPITVLGFSDSLVLTLLLLVALFVVEGVLNHYAARTSRQIDSMKYTESNNEVEEHFTSGKVAEQKIKHSLFQLGAFTGVFSVGMLVLGILLFFVPYFSVLVDKISVFDMLKNVVLELVHNKPAIYEEMMKEISQGCLLMKICTGEIFQIWFGVGMMIFMLLLPCFLISPISYFVRYYKFENNSQYRGAILQRYEELEENKTRIPVGGSFFGVIFITAMTLPCFDFFLALPKYFNGLTSSFYIYIFVATMICFVVGIWGERFLGCSKKHKNAMFAFAELKNRQR